jgi:hypothetical protein
MRDLFQDQIFGKARCYKIEIFDFVSATRLVAVFTYVNSTTCDFVIIESFHQKLDLAFQDHENSRESVLYRTPAQ